MDDGDDGFVLNVSGAGLEPNEPSKNAFGRSKKPRSWAEKKANKKQNVNGRSSFGRPRDGGGGAAPAHAPREQQLKGYSLDIEAPVAEAPRYKPPPPQHQHQKQAIKRAASPEPPSENMDEDEDADNAPPAARTADPNAVPRRKRGRVQEKQRIGRLRIISKQAGDREATPDQDDILAGSEDDYYEEDLMATVAAAVRRDKAVEEEIAAQRGSNKGDGNKEVDLYGSDSESGGEDPGYKKKDLDLEIWEEGVEHFDPDGERYPVLRTKKERKEWKKTDRSANMAVRPGELTHRQPAGDRDGAAATKAGVSSQRDQDVFAAPPGSSGKSGQKGGGELSSFTSLGLSETMNAHLATLGYAQPTTVQQQVIPLLLEGRDALVNAPTGSGKTLCYLAPIIQHLAELSPRLTRADGTAAVIIVPTHELCLQVVDAATLLARRFAWIVPGGVHGGENRSKEKARLRKGVTIIVATPGRLMDHLENTTAFKTDALRWLVLDEADRLLDLGFEKKLADIMAVLEERVAAGCAYSGREPIPRRSVLLSATLPSGMGVLVRLSLRNPATVGFTMQKNGEPAIREVAGEEEEEEEDMIITTNNSKSSSKTLPGFDSNTNDKFVIPKQLRQKYVDVPCKLRLVALAALLKVRIEAAPTRAKLVVFFSSCDSVEFHHAVLQEAWPVATGSSLLPPSAPLLKLHGTMPQAERTAALLRFSKAPAGVLLCTDVAARGLDFPAVSGIFQYDPPGSAEEYVHRVGRTARLGASGEAVLFIMPAEREFVTHLGSHGVEMREESMTMALDVALGMDARAGKSLPIERHHGAFHLQNKLMDAVARSKHLTHKAEMGFRSFVRAYATHSSELKPFFSVRMLHLGHAAHSFALKERPGMVGDSVLQTTKKRAETSKFRANKNNNGKQQRNSGFSTVAKRGGGGYVLD